jgi:hypothetical protein
MAGMFKAFLRTIHLSPDSSAALPPASLKKRPRAPDTELPLLVSLEELYTGRAGLLLGGGWGWLLGVLYNRGGWYEVLHHDCGGGGGRGCPACPLGPGGMAVGQLHTGWGHDTPGVPRGAVHRWAGGWGEEIWGWLLGVWEKRGGWYEVLPDCWVEGGVAVGGGGSCT